MDFPEIEKGIKEQEGLDPMDWTALKDLGKQMVEDMFDFLSDIRAKPVWCPVPENIRDRLRHDPFPECGVGARSAYEEFKSLVLPYPRGNIHPRFWGWVNGSGVPVAMLADFLASSFNSTVSYGENAAVMVEEAVLSWFKMVMEWPKEGDALLTSGCSMGQIIALAAARQAKSGFDVRQEGLHANKPLTVYASTETHLSVDKAVELLGIGRRFFHKIPVQPDFRIDVSALRRQIQLDRSAGHIPICVIANVGTVNSGAIDPLSDLVTLCREEDIWLHLDGAFGAFAYLSPEYRPLLKGLNQADSLVFDFHKWFYLPFDASCALFRERTVLENAFKTSAGYVSRTNRGPASYDIAFADKGIEQTRRFRALKIWLALKTHGFSGFREAIEKNIRHIEHLRTLVEVHPNLEIVAGGLNILCFRYIKPDTSLEELNALNQEILSGLQMSGKAVPSHTFIDGKFVIRVANNNHRTEAADFDYLVKEILAIAVRCQGTKHAD